MTQRHKRFFVVEKGMATSICIDGCMQPLYCIRSFIHTYASVIILLPSFKLAEHVVIVFKSLHLEN